MYGSSSSNIPSYFNRFYQKEKKQIDIDEHKIYLLDSYLLNPININESVKDFCQNNSNYVIWMDVISVIFDILPPHHPSMIINTNTYWNRNMWSLYLTFILFKTSLDKKMKKMVDFDYSNFDKLYQYIYSNFQDYKKLVGKDKIIPPWSDFILENIPEDFFVNEDDDDWGSSFQESDYDLDPKREENYFITAEEKKKQRRLESKERKQIQKEEEEQERRLIEEEYQAREDELTSDWNDYQGRY